MVKFIVAGIAALLSIGNATASIEVFLAPPGWQRSTDSTAEIKDYLTSTKSGDKTVENSYLLPVIFTAVTAYRNQVQQQINGMFTQTELKKFSGTICKIDITTGNTAIDDPDPPELFALDYYADNSRAGCQVLIKKLEKLVTHGRFRQYPVRAKEHGMLSIDMLWVYS